MLRPLRQASLGKEDEMQHLSNRGQRAKSKGARTFADEGFVWDNAAAWLTRGHSNPWRDDQTDRPSAMASKIRFLPETFSCWCVPLNLTSLERASDVSAP